MDCKFMACNNFITIFNTFTRGALEEDLRGINDREICLRKYPHPLPFRGG